MTIDCDFFFYAQFYFDLFAISFLSLTLSY